MQDQATEGMVSRRFQLLVIYTALLFASFSFDVFQLNAGLRDSYIGFDSYLVLNRLKLASEGAALWSPPGTYLSQFGLQAALLGGLQTAWKLDPIRFAHLAAYGCTLLTALTLSSFFVSVARLFGPIAGHVGVTLTAFSTIFLVFAPSVYWCVFLLLAPFVATWRLYPRLSQTGWGYGILLGLLTVLVLVKALCGYEYITTVILGPTVAAVFHQCRGQEPFRRRLLGLGGIVIAGGLGFALAMVLHAWQIEHYLGQDGMKVILQRARHRTLEGNPLAELDPGFQSSLFASLPEPYVHPLNCFFSYFSQRAWHWPGSAGPTGPGVSAATVTLFSGSLILWWGLQRRRVPERMRGLIPALAVSVLTSLSWQAMAINHMCVHFHLNLIVFYLPFLLLAYAGLGCLAQGVVERLGGVELWNGLAVPAWLVLVLVGVLVQLDAATARKSNDFQAGQAVRNALGSESGIGDQAPLRYSLDEVRLQGQSVAGEWTAELERSQLVQSRLAPEQSRQELVVSGWAFDPRTPRAPKALVVLRDGAFLQVQAYAFDRLDVESAYEMRAPDCGFLLVVPEIQPEDLERLRVFFVTGWNFEWVYELPIQERIPPAD